MKYIHSILFLLLVSTVLFTGCAVYDYFFTTTPEDALNNKNFHWISDTVNSIVYYYEPNSFASQKIERIKKVTENGQERIFELINEKEYPYYIKFFVVASGSRMEKLIGLRGNSYAYPRFNAVYAVYSEKIKAIGAHEFNHVIVHNLWGRQGEKVLSEGFAVYSDNKWHGHDLHALCNYLQHEGRLIKISELIKNFSDFSPMTTYPQSGSFIKYLYEKYGVNKLRALWRNGTGELPDIYHKTMDDIEKEWLETIVSSEPGNISY